MMPFKSEAQRGWMWVHAPKVARKWAHEYPGRKLPKKSPGVRKKVKR